MESRLCCKNCKYCTEVMVNGNTNSFCAMFSEVLESSRIDIVGDVNVGKCEMFEDVERNILGVIENEN